MNLILKRETKRLIFIISLVALLLLILFATMFFTDQVNWTLFDFIIAGILLLTFGLLIETAIRNIQKRKHKILICSFILFMLIITWVELAVGVF
jgi:hypothetical protein